MAGGVHVVAPSSQLGDDKLWGRGAQPIAHVMRMCICCEGGPVPIGACALWQRRSTARVIMAGAFSDARAKGAHARPHVEEH